jgi:hypothetical protein
MSKVKCYAYRKFGHYAGQCLNKKGGNETQLDVVVLAKAQMDEFPKKFEQLELLLVSQITLGTISVDASLIDSGASCHLIGARELFESFTKSDSDLYMELGMAGKHAMQGSGTMPFWMESGGILRVTNVLWVVELRRIVLSVSVIEKKGYEVLVRDGLLDLG